MTPTDPQADRLRDALHQRVDTLPDAAISFESVRDRAGRARRNRRIAAGVGVAAVVAIVAPLAAVAQGGLTADPRPLPPAAPPSGAVDREQVPTPTGEQKRFTTEGLTSGEATEVPWIDVRGERVVAGDLVIDSVDMPQDAVRWAGGLLVTGDAGDARLYVLDEAGDLVADPVELPSARTLVGAPALGEVAWVQESADGGQEAVVSDDDDVVTAHDQLVVALPEIGGFEPVGIGPDGLVLNATYPSGESEVLLAGRDGGVRQVPRLRSATGVSTADGTVIGSLDFESTPCSGAVDPDSGAIERGGCEVTHRSLSPDGRWITATVIDADGYGDPSLLVLDAATGEVQTGWSSRSNPPITWMQHQWEDADTVLATVVEGGEASLVRFEPDGSAERVVGPVDQEPYGEQVLVLPED